MVIRIRNKSFKNQRVALFVDIQNMYYSAKNMYDGKVNYRNILKAAQDKRKLIRALAYVIKASTKNEDNFFDALEDMGFFVKRKDLKKFHGGAKKGDWDMGIAIDAIELSEKIDVAVLVTGDGDFTSLVNHIKAKGVQVEVMSFKKSTASELIEASDVYIDLAQNQKKFLE